MKNKKLGRIAAILMAGTLMMSTVTAFGADLSTGASASTDTYVDFEKEIVLIDIFRYCNWIFNIYILRSSS